MIKYGCMALVAMACSAVAPEAHSQGSFFVAGQIGRANYNDVGLDDNTATTRALSGGYRWQAGSIVQVGVEAGFGEIDEISGDFFFYSDGYWFVTGRASLESEYRHLGASARFDFGPDSRWFAIARAGYMAYEMDAGVHFEVRREGTPVDYPESSSSDDGGGAYFGAGIGFDITPNVNVNVMYNGYAYSDFESDDFSEDDIGTASTTTLGVEVRF